MVSISLFLFAPLHPHTSTSDRFYHPVKLPPFTYFFYNSLFYDMSFLNIFCFLSRCGKPPPRTSGAGFFKNYFLLLVSFSDGLFEWVPSDLNISIKIICWDIMHTLTKRPSSWVCWSSTWSSWSSSWSRPHQPREEEASDWTWVEDRTLVRDLVFLDKWSWS